MAWQLPKKHGYLNLFVKIWRIAHPLRRRRDPFYGRDATHPPGFIRHRPLNLWGCVTTDAWDGRTFWSVGKCYECVG